MIWKCRRFTFDTARRPLVMGILNVTPDSFSDGGRHHTVEAALAHAETLLADGADILDIGGESSRPGASSVAVEEELSRIEAVVEVLGRRGDVCLSIDTVKPQVARRCLELGAAIINDISGFRDPQMIQVAREFNAGVVAMHMQGTPATMQDNPSYRDVVSEVREFLAERLLTLRMAGLPSENLAIDPGISFGKTLEHNLTLLKRLKEFQSLGRPLCLGVSRKGMFGQLLNRPREQRMAASLACATFSIAERSAQVIRVHDVRETADAAKLWAAIQNG